MTRVADARARGTGLKQWLDDIRQSEHAWDDLANSVAAEPTVSPSLNPLREFPRPAGVGGPNIAPELPTIGGRKTSGVAAEGREQVTALVKRVFLPVSHEPLRCVAFAGVEARSGPVAVMAAEILASQVDSAVCIVDGNLWAPWLHEYFGVGVTPSLSDALMSGSPLAAAAREVRQNLWFVSSGFPSTSPSFTSHGARLQLAQFIAEFSYVIVELGALGSTGDASGLAPLVGNVILVLAAESTRRESARRTAQVLQAAGTSVVGAVLTNRRYPIPEAIYRRL
jgi:hypothetical protein